VKKAKIEDYGPSVLRLGLGLLFIIPGWGKLMAPAGIIGMLGNIGFPAPAFFGWVLLLSELVFGLTVLIGYKVKYSVWPLLVILVVATVTVYLPDLAANKIMILFHLVGIAALVSLYLTGPGALAVDKE